MKQGLNVSINDLIILKQELIDQVISLNKTLGIERPVDYQRRFMVDIINKEGLSDTWEIKGAKHGS